MRIVLVLVFSLITSFAFGEMTLKDGNYETTVVFTPAQYKAMKIIVPDVEAWIQRAAHNKARICKERVLKFYTDYRHDKLTEAEKDTAINALNVLTREERNAAALAKLIGE